MKEGSIVIDCERMKYPYTGLFQFCLHLSKSLIKANSTRPLCLYAPSSVKKMFAPETCFLKQHGWHKLIFPSTNKAALWHCTHQDADYFPFTRKVKKLLTVHDVNYLHDETKSSEKKKKFVAALQKKIGATDAIVAISEYSLNDLKMHFDIGNKPTSVIYNGCTINEELPLAQPTFIPTKSFLFSIGTIASKKNFHVLPRLLPNSDFDLVIAGITQNEQYKSAINAEAQKLGVEDRLHFTGPVNDAEKQWYFKNCKAFVFPSIAEGFGLPVVEAMYFGCPLLLSSATSLPEIGGDVATYFTSFEESDMRQALVKCLQRYEAVPKLKEAIQSRANLFSWQEAANKYLKLYESLLNN